MNFICREHTFLDSYSGAGSLVTWLGLRSIPKANLCRNFLFLQEICFLRNKVCILGNKWLHYLAFNCSAVNKTRSFMSCFYSVFAEGEPLTGNKALVGFQGCSSDQKVQLLLWWLLTGRDPRGFVSGSTVTRHPARTPFPPWEQSPSGKHPPPLGKTFALGSHLAWSHFLFPWFYNLSCISSTHAFCHVALSMLGVQGTKVMSFISDVFSESLLRWWI